ncbi:hypothetical protein [Lactococcus cremoris]
MHVPFILSPWHYKLAQTRNRRT